MSASTPKRVCWDACAWISLIQKEKIRDAKGAVTEDRYGLCRVVIDLAEKGRIEVVTSGLSLAEVCKSPGIKKGRVDQVGPYFENDWVLVVPVDTLVGTTARALMMTGYAGLKPPDAIHLATAIVANADELHTFDGDLLDLDEQLARRDGNMLKICKPSVAASPAPLLDSPAQANKGDQDADDTTEAAAAEPDGEPNGALPANGEGDGLQPEPGGVREGAGENRAGDADREAEVEEEWTLAAATSDREHGIDESPQVTGSSPVASTGHLDGGAAQRESGGLNMQSAPVPGRGALSYALPEAPPPPSSPEKA